MENAFLQGSAGIETIGNGLEFLMWQFQASNLSLSVTVTVIQEIRGRAYFTLLGLSLLRWLGLCSIAKNMRQSKSYAALRQCGTTFARYRLEPQADTKERVGVLTILYLGIMTQRKKSLCAA
jgi:hypothetical protein